MLYSYLDGLIHEAARLIDSRWQAVPSVLSVLLKCTKLVLRTDRAILS